LIDGVDERDLDFKDLEVGVGRVMDLAAAAEATLGELEVAGVEGLTVLG
jgi:hypothetical protein